MIIRALYKNQEVLFTVPEGRLVFDGNAYVSPEEAKWVALYWFEAVEALLPQTYPVDFPKTFNQMAWSNYWACRVLGVNSSGDGSEEAGVVVSTLNPITGQCLCGVTCVGTEVQNVQVFQKV